jgi:hypothetical protein
MGPTPQTQSHSVNCTCITLSEGGMIGDPWCPRHGNPRYTPEPRVDIPTRIAQRAWPGTEDAGIAAGRRALANIDKALGMLGQPVCGPPAEVRCECTQYWICGSHDETCPRFVKRSL